MKKKTLKILALAAALILIAGLLWIANGLVGNPISKALARRGAESYMTETYAGTDYQINEVGFDFKSGQYLAKIFSPSSPDTRFSLSITGSGRIRWDSFNDNVADRWNTYQRLDMEYREMVEKVLESPAFPYRSEICFGDLEMISREAMNDPNFTDRPDDALCYSDLKLDGIYDISALGRECGNIVFYFDSEQADEALAAEILLELRSQMDRAGIGFRSVSLVLRPPKTEEAGGSENRINLEGFPYEDIYEEDLEQRILEADAALDAWYAEQDVIKNSMIPSENP